MLKANGNRVLLRPEKYPEKSSGGLYIPQNLNNQTLYGIVLHVGDAVDKEKYKIKEGDKAFYNQHASGVLRMGLDGEDVLSLPIDEIGVYSD